MKAKEEKIINESEVAKLLTNQINICEKTQKVIAADVGFAKPNMITMIKQGRTKLPIAKVIVLAESLEVDAKDLLKMCLKEYQQENWQVIKEVFCL